MSKPAHEIIAEMASRVMSQLVSKIYPEIVNEEVILGLAESSVMCAALLYKESCKYCNENDL